MATHSSILAWRIPWTEEPGGLQSWSCKELDVTERAHIHTQQKLRVFKINHTPTKIKKKNGCEISLKKRRKFCPHGVVSSADLMTWTCYIWLMVIGGQGAFHRHPHSLPQLGHHSPPEGTSCCLGWKLDP